MFNPHTPADRREMLQAIGVETSDDLFKAIPESTRFRPLDLPPVLTEMEAGEHTLLVRAKDDASNFDPTPATSTFYVDGTAPTIDITRPANGNRFVLGSDVNSIFSCTDPLVGSPPGNSGIKTCSGPGKVDTSTLGEHTFTVGSPMPYQEDPSLWATLEMIKA